MTRQPAYATINVIKQYFTIMLAVIISSAYILLLVIQQLNEMLKENKANVDNPEELRQKKKSLSSLLNQ